jgi:non-specific serine/threonine protein kinase
MGDKWRLARVVGWVGLAAVWSGDEHDLAEGLLKEALALDRELGSWSYGAYCLESFAGLAGTRGQVARAARLWGAAEALRTDIGAPRPLDDTRLLYERSMAATRSQLGAEAWETAFAEGMAMSAEAAAEYALSQEVAHIAPERLPAGGKTDEPPTTDPLTTREREVVILVAQGMSNGQIAQKLFLSEHTVKRHISKILRKLGLASRTEIAAWATERLLLTQPSE